MNFRRVITALAVLALFAGLASAQNPQPNLVNCTVSASTNPTVRAEGINERVGDLLITCVGGTAPAAGSVADRVNLSVNYGVVVTSPNADVMSPMLFVDEPGTMTNTQATAIGIAGYGPNATMGNQVATGLCTNALSTGTVWVPSALAGPFVSGGSCAAYANLAGGYVVGTTTAAGGTNMVNAYQGAVGTTSSTNTTVTFSNVPFIATGAANVSRIFRIHNVRVTPGSAASIVATVTPTSVAGSAQAPNITSGNGATVATPSASLTASLSQLTAGASLCASTSLNPTAGSGLSKANVTLLSFKPTFGSAFKTRNLPLTPGAATTSYAAPAVTTAGDAETPVVFTNLTGASALPTLTHMQSVLSGSVKIGSNTYSTANSETGVIFSDGVALYGIGATAGTDLSTGTRFKASFANLPANVTYYVSIANVTDFQTNPATVPALVGDDTVTPYAVIAGSETGAYAPTALVACPAPGPCGNNVVPLVQLVPASGKASIVWEVTNTSPSSPATYSFAVYAVYTTSTPPAIGNTATVTLGYADANGGAATTPVGVTTTNIPRFASQTTSTNAATPFLNVIACQTALLFPYITNVTGYETGIAIDNTSTDPFGTVQGSGTCNMWFYGTNQPSGAIVLTSGTGQTVLGSNTAAGQSPQIANTASGLGLVNFTGYGIAVCNFQFAHGFAFVQTSKQTLGMGYLPLVMQTGVGLNSRGQALVGETLTP